MCQIWYIDCRAQPKFDDGFTKPVAGNLSLPSPVHDNMEHRTVIRSLTWQTEFLMRKPGRMSTTSCHDLNILFKNKLRMVRRTHLLTYLNKCCINEFKVQSDHINSHHKLTYGRGLVPYWLLSISPWLSAVVEPKQAIVIVRSRCGESGACLWWHIKTHEILCVECLDSASRGVTTCTVLSLSHSSPLNLGSCLDAWDLLIMSFMKWRWILFILSTFSMVTVNQGWAGG